MCTYLRYLGAFVWVVFLAAGCSSGGSSEPSTSTVPPEEPVDTTRAQIDAYIRGLDTLPVANRSLTEGEVSAPVVEGDYSCSTQDFEETRQFEKLIAYSANSDSLWPGALVAGSSIPTGQFTQLGLRRGPLTFSVSLPNLAGPTSGQLPDPSLSSFRDVVGTILKAELTGSIPARMYAEIEQVHSREQLALAVGAGASWLGVVDVSAGFDFSKEHVKSRFFVKYIQSYYTVDVDVPRAPVDFLAEDVTLEEVQTEIFPDNPPAYVASITYGRLIAFTFESEYSASEMSSALNMVYQGGANVSGDYSLTYDEMISHSKMTAYILGGSAGAAAQSIESYESLLALIHDGGEFSPDSPGAPIAYKLNYLKDNTPVRLAFTDEYQVKTCARVGQLVKVTLKNIAVDVASDSGDDLELFGLITATATDEGTLFDKDSDNAVAILEGETWPAVGDISEALLHVVPQAGEEITLQISLHDDDGPLSSPDLIGEETVALPFELGWRREVRRLLTGSGSQVQVTFDLTPI